MLVMVLGDLVLLKLTLGQLWPDTRANCTSAAILSLSLGRKRSVSKTFPKFQFAGNRDARQSIHTSIKP